MPFCSVALNLLTGTTEYRGHTPDHCISHHQQDALLSVLESSRHFIWQRPKSSPVTMPIVLFRRFLPSIQLGKLRYSKDSTTLVLLEILETPVHDSSLEPGRNESPTRWTRDQQAQKNGKRNSSQPVFHDEIHRRPQHPNNLVVADWREYGCFCSQPEQSVGSTVG